MIWALRIGLAFAVSGLIYGGYRQIEGNGYERCEADMRDAVAQSISAYQMRLKKAEEERDAKQVMVDRLAADVRRLRIHLPTCPDGTSENQNGGTGAFSDGVDESFARLQERTTELIRRCDELNLDAIKTNAAAK